jgi:hypothetical protein
MVAVANALKLRAEDAEDLQVLASSLQDALLQVADMAYLTDQRRFALVFSRFCWERTEGQGQQFLRTHCAVAFDGITNVRLHGIDRQQRERMLELLTIEVRPAGAAVEIDLVFAGQATIRLDAERIHCHLEDLGEPWPTPWRPAHGA